MHSNAGQLSSHHFMHAGVQLSISWYLRQYPGLVFVLLIFVFIEFKHEFEDGLVEGCLIYIDCQSAFDKQ